MECGAEEGGGGGGGGGYALGMRKHDNRFPREFNTIRYSLVDVYPPRSVVSAGLRGTVYTTPARGAAPAPGLGALSATGSPRCCSENRKEPIRLSRSLATVRPMAARARRKTSTPRGDRGAMRRGGDGGGRDTGYALVKPVR